jgi:hypothetical protein
MHSFIRVRIRTTLRRWSALATLLGALLLSAGPLVEPAAAYVPAQDLIDAIRAKNAALRAQNWDNWVLHYASELWGPDGIRGPDGTPDGRGAFAFYIGNTGIRGAIYAMRYGAGIDVYSVQPPILDSWGAAGYELGYGYPIRDRFPATAFDQRLGCPSYAQTQWFLDPRTERSYTACVDDNGVVRWFE